MGNGRDMMYTWDEWRRSQKMNEVNLDVPVLVIESVMSQTSRVCFTHNCHLGLYSRTIRFDEVNRILSIFVRELYLSPHIITLFIE